MLTQKGTVGVGIEGPDKMWVKQHLSENNDWQHLYGAFLQRKVFSQHFVRDFGQTALSENDKHADWQFD